MYGNTLYQNISKDLSPLLQDLYYQKIIEYQPVLNNQGLHHHFQTLHQTLESFNTAFTPIVQGKTLPEDLPESIWLIDFARMTEAMEKDTTQHSVLVLRKEIIDDQFEKDRLPSFSVSLGYDLSRKRFYYGVNLGVNISRPNKKNIILEKQLLEERNLMQIMRKQKSLLNLQYEYGYKRKQYQDLHFQLLELEEQHRLYQVKRNILSLEESIEEQQLSLKSLMIRYEMLDVAQQCALLMLRLKKLIFPLNINDFIKKNDHPVALKKYPRKRYLKTRENVTLTPAEKLFLNQNEIRPVTDKELVLVKNLILINPDNFTNRSDMEQHILSSKPESNILISDLQAFERLELRTIRAQTDINSDSIHKKNNTIETF